jgi:hypothetical protein
MDRKEMLQLFCGLQRFLYTVLLCFVFGLELAGYSSRYVPQLPEYFGGLVILVERTIFCLYSKMQRQKVVTD